MKLPEPVAWSYKHQDEHFRLIGYSYETEKPKNCHHPNFTKLYSEAQVKELLAQADQDLSDSLTVVHLSAMHEAKRRYEPVLREAMRALEAAPECDKTDAAIVSIMEMLSVHNGRNRGN